MITINWTYSDRRINIVVGRATARGREGETHIPNMTASNFEWILRAACSPGSCLLFDLPLLAAGGLAIVFWWYQRNEDNTW